VSSSQVSLDDLRDEAEKLLAAVPAGAPLDAQAGALVRLAVHASVCTLDPAGIEDAITGALDAGATAEQVHEVLVLVSALGVHTLMEGSRTLSAVLRERGDAAPPTDPARAQLRRRLPGDDPYWAAFEGELPGFLDALLEHSPEAYEAMFAYCALPWRSGTVRARVKELASMACDATPNHRFLPGMRLHLANAVRLGTGAAAVREALQIAASAPPHPGVG
jgi:alkylhydroperoxidase/carboxymuconolactone decarboxylase family protein YurZ